MILGDQNVMIDLNGRTYRVGEPILASGFWLLASFFLWLLASQVFAS